MRQGNVYGGKFCSPDERQITTIGTGYIANFVSGGGAERAGATLTNMRIYFTGKIFMLNENGKLSSFKQQKIVNVRDVTGTGYLLYSPTSLLIWGIITLVVGIITFLAPIGFLPDDALNYLAGLSAVSGIILLVAYFIGRKTLFSVEYAGGIIAFDARWLQKDEQDIFIRNIHLAKDKLYSRAAVEQGFSDGRSPSTGRVNDYAVGADEIPDL